MRSSITGVTGEMVLTKGEPGYRDVLDAFPTASKVTVVTYNISRKEDALLAALRHLDVPVRLITRIPARLDSYRGGSSAATSFRARAASDIQLYLERLAPEEFGPLATISFSFANHAKIIMTDAVGYVGSANYSQESANNWEAGIIVRDSDVLRQVDRFVDEIECASVRYYGRSMIEKIAPLLAARQRLTQLGSQLEGDVLLIDPEAAEDSLLQVRRAIEESDRVWSELRETSGPVYSHIGSRQLAQVEKYFERGGAFWALADAAQKYESAKSIDAGALLVDDNGLIPASEFQDAQERIELLRAERDRHTVAAQVAIGKLPQRIARICQSIDEVCNDISSHLRMIDNTK